MTPVEIKELIKTLRECGVTHYKAGDVEIDIGPEPVIMDKDESREINQKAHNTIEEISSLLKLSDQDLVNRLFPDYTEDKGGDEEPIDITN